MRFLQLMGLLVIVGMAQSTFADREGHGPQITRMPKANERFSSVVLAQEADLGANATRRFVGHFQKRGPNSFTLRLLDEAFQVVPLALQTPLQLKVIEVPRNTELKPVVNKIETSHKLIEFDSTLRPKQLAVLEVIFEIENKKYVVALTQDQLKAW